MVSFFSKVALLVGLVAIIDLSVGLTCARDAKVMTKCALCDGASGTIDLTPIFSGGALNAVIPARHLHNYLFDPTKGVNCSDGSVTTCTRGVLAMCQINYQMTTYSYGLGYSQTAAFNVSASDLKSNMWVVNVTFTGGDSKRQVDVEFVYDAKATKPMYTYIKEDPILHYHLRVTSSLVMPSKLEIDSNNHIPVAPGTDIAIAVVLVPLVVLALLVAVVVVATVLVCSRSKKKRSSRGTNGSAGGINGAAYDPDACGAQPENHSATAAGFLDAQRYTSLKAPDVPQLHTQLNTTTNPELYEEVGIPNHYMEVTADTEYI